MSGRHHFIAAARTVSNPDCQQPVPAQRRRLQMPPAGVRQDIGANAGGWDIGSSLGSDKRCQAGIPSTVSFGLSHIGSIVSPSLALENARLMADALAPLGTALMIR